jgi:hypothetical protein
MLQKHLRLIVLIKPFWFSSCAHAPPFRTLEEFRHCSSSLTQTPESDYLKVNFDAVLTTRFESPVIPRVAVGRE